MTAPGNAVLKAGICGLGTVGLAVARWLDGCAGGLDVSGKGEPEKGLTLAAVSAGDKERAREKVGGFKTPVPVVELGELADLCDVIVECAPPEKFQEIAEPAVKFPANVNVAVALGLAGIGPDKTQYEIWADPGVTRNSHTIKVDADTVAFEMTIANVPTGENPATGKLVPLSVIETLRGLVIPFKAGT